MHTDTLRALEGRNRYRVHYSESNYGNLIHKKKKEKKERERKKESDLTPKWSINRHFESLVPWYFFFF